MIAILQLVRHLIPVPVRTSSAGYCLLSNGAHRDRIYAVGESTEAKNRVLMSVSQRSPHVHWCFDKCLAIWDHDHPSRFLL